MDIDRNLADLQGRNDEDNQLLALLNIRRDLPQSEVKIICDTLKAAIADRSRRMLELARSGGEAIKIGGEAVKAIGMEVKRAAKSALKQGVAEAVAQSKGALEVSPQPESRQIMRQHLVCVLADWLFGREDLPPILQKHANDMFKWFSLASTTAFREIGKLPAGYTSSRSLYRYYSENMSRMSEAIAAAKEMRQHPKREGKRL